MLAAEGRDFLVARLRQDGRLVARDIADELRVPEHVGRGDLRELASAGLCQRVYGGALPPSPITSDFTHRSQSIPETKRRVGARAAMLVTPGSSSSTTIIDSGTTALAVALELAPSLVGTVVTRSPAVVMALMSHPGVDVVLLGGRALKPVASTCGTAAADWRNSARKAPELSTPKADGP